MLKTNIKVSAVKNLTDARYFASREVQWMGFCLDEGSEDFLAPHLIKAIAAWVDGPEPVGEFGLASALEIREKANDLDLQAVQLDFLTGVDVMQDLAGDFTIFKVIVLETSTDEPTLLAWVEQFAPYSDFFVFDFEKNNFSKKDLENDKPVGLPFLKEIFKKHKCLLSINESPENIEDLITALQPFGLSIKGGEEEKTGYKSFDQMDAIFEKLELEDV